MSFTATTSLANRYTGIVDNYNAEKNYGFIRVVHAPNSAGVLPGTHPNVFVHAKALPSAQPLNMGEYVEFSVAVNREGKVHATSVTGAYGGMLQNDFCEWKRVNRAPPRAAAVHPAPPPLVASPPPRNDPGTSNGMPSAVEMPRSVRPPLSSGRPPRSPPKPNITNNTPSFGGETKTWKMAERPAVSQVWDDSQGVYGQGL